MKLHAVEGSAVRPRSRTARRTRRCRARPRRARERARRSARGRRRSGSAGSASSGEPGCVKLTSFQPMCGSFSGAGSSARTSPAMMPRPAAPPSSLECSKASCMPRQMPSTGVPAATRSRSSSSRPSSAGSVHRAREGAHAGHDEAGGGAQRVGVAADGDARADVLERLLHRAAVAHAVVDDRDLHGLLQQRAHRLSVPFVLGTPVSPGSIATAWRRARANALKAASIMWWALLPASTRRCSVSLAALASARKNSSVSSWSKPPVEPGGRSALEQREGPPGDVDRAARARLVHRHGRPAVAGDARRARRAPGRAPARARWRCPRRCGGRRSAGRR